jgi:hypothetical protein
MATLIQNLRRTWTGGGKREARDAEAQPAAQPATRTVPAVEIAPNDPLVAYFLSSPAATEVDKINLDSPALRELRAAGTMLVVPLVSQGELIGLLNLGPRLSGQD